MGKLVRLNNDELYILGELIKDQLNLNNPYNLFQYLGEPQLRGLAQKLEPKQESQ